MDETQKAIMNRADKAERLIALEAETKILIDALAIFNAKLVLEGIVTNAVFDAAYNIGTVRIVLSKLTDSLLLGSVPDVTETVKQANNSVNNQEEQKGGPTIGPSFF